MPRKWELTWQVGTGGRSGRWRKKYKGKTFYFPFGTSKSDLDGYQQAITAWERKKAEVDAAMPKPHQLEYEVLIREWSLVLDWSIDHDDQHHASIARTKIEVLRNRLAMPVPPPTESIDRFNAQFETPKELLDVFSALEPVFTPAADTGSRTMFVPPKDIVDSMDGSPNRIRREIWEDRLKVQDQKKRAVCDSVGANVDTFLLRKREQVDAGEMTAGRYDPLRGHLYHFRDWLGATVSVTSMTSKIVADYHTELLNGIRQEKWSNDYAKDRLNVVKTFIRWLWSNEIIENLPRVLGEKNQLVISRRITVPEVFSIDEVKELLTTATTRTRLYLLIMLNTGMTQKDISDLKQSEVDWKNGTITRKRSKTATHVGVPTVCYKLWKETFRLLRQERSSDLTRVLVNQDGGPLKVEALDAAGKLLKIDNVASAFSRLRRLTEINKPLKLFRKTSATLLRSAKEYSGVEVLFLGHSPRSVSDRHYAQPPQALLDEAVTWLGKQYGIK